MRFRGFCVAVCCVACPRPTPRVMRARDMPLCGNRRMADRPGGRSLRARAKVAVCAQTGSCVACPRSTPRVMRARDMPLCGNRRMAASPASYTLGTLPRPTRSGVSTCSHHALRGRGQPAVGRDSVAALVAEMALCHTSSLTRHPTGATLPYLGRDSQRCCFLQ